MYAVSRRYAYVFGVLLLGAQTQGDMLQFPLASWTWPEWLPYIGGKPYTFFEYVFNIADAAISSGVGILLFLNKRIVD